MADRIIDGYIGDDKTRLPIKATDNGDGTFSIGTALEGVEVSENALSVHVKTIHTNLINSIMHFETAIFSTFANATAAQSRSFDLVSAAGFTIGDRVQIENGVVETNYPSIINIVGNTITLNRPLDKDYTIADGIRKIETNMAVNGSVTPVSFKVVAEASTSIAHITRMLFEMTHAGSGDMGLFGDLPALANGVLFRAWYKRTGEYKTVSIWKTNSDMAIDMFDVRFDDRSGGQGIHGTSGRWTFTTGGIVAELDPSDEPDFLEMLIQDDLTSLSSFRINMQGHTED